MVLPVVISSGGPGALLKDIEFFAVVPAFLIDTSLNPSNFPGK